MDARGKFREHERCVRVARGDSKFFYNIADKNACFSINYTILLTRDTIKKASIGWLQTRHNGLVWMQILSVKLRKKFAYLGPV